jgi:uncharacterized protein
MQHKEVRDLAWAVKSPSLVSSQDNWPSVVDSNESDWIDTWLLTLDNNPSPLRQHLAKEKSHFLGIYFESLWSFYLEAHPSFNLIAKNLQVNAQKKTIGEFDFIIQDRKSGAFIHQEIAIKFYLGFKRKNTYSFSDGEHTWLGPQCRDRLDLKMNKLINTQTRLSKTEAGQHTLNSACKQLTNENNKNINQISSQVVLKGYLFYPEDNTVIAPNYCNPKHLRGNWVTLKSLTQQTHKIETANAWQLLSKSDWISPYQLDHKREQTEPYRDSFIHQADLIEAVNERINKENRPWMIAYLKQHTKGYIEENRVFVVPDNWPNLNPSK